MIRSATARTSSTHTRSEAIEMGNAQRGHLFHQHQHAVGHAAIPTGTIRQRKYHLTMATNPEEPGRETGGRPSFP